MGRGEKLKMKKNIKLVLPEKTTAAVIASAIFFIAVIGIYSHRETIFSHSQISDEKEQPAFVKVEVVAADKTVRDSIVQNTSIDAVDRIKLLPRVTGRLEKLYVKKGDMVKKGQVLATLEHIQQDALIASTIAQAASAKADSERAKAEMMNAQANLERYERLVKEGFSTKQQYDSIKTEYASTKASYNASLAKERQASAELKRVNSSRGDYIMTAPFSGTVLDDYSMAEGAMISPSSPIMDIADLGRLKATLKIPEVKIFSVKPGMEVFIRFDALPSEEFIGRVTKIDPYVDPSTRTSSVEIEIDNGKKANGRLRPGMFGQASIIEKEYKNCIVVPESALHTDKNGYHVFIVNNGVARLKNVSAGIKQGSSVQILSGIESGDRVVIFGGNNINNGEKVFVETR